MAANTLEEIAKRTLDLNSRVRRVSIIKQRYKTELLELFKKRAILEFGLPGDTIKFKTPQGEIHTGKISNFDQCFFEDKVVCFVKVEGDFLPYETHVFGSQIIR
jgi:hypothetical protein